MNPTRQACASGARDGFSTAPSSDLLRIFIIVPDPWRRAGMVTPDYTEPAQKNHKYGACLEATEEQASLIARGIEAAC